MPPKVKTIDEVAEYNQLHPQNRFLQGKEEAERGRRQFKVKTIDQVAEHNQRRRAMERAMEMQDESLIDGTDWILYFNENEGGKVPYYYNSSTTETVRDMPEVVKEALAPYGQGGGYRKRTQKSRKSKKKSRKKRRKNKSKRKKRSKRKRSKRRSKRR